MFFLPLTLSLFGVFPPAPRLLKVIQKMKRDKTKLILIACLGQGQLGIQLCYYHELECKAIYFISRNDNKIAAHGAGKGRDRTKILHTK